MPNSLRISEMIVNGIYWQKKVIRRLLFFVFIPSLLFQHGCKRDVPVFIQCDRTVNLGDCMVSALTTIGVTYTSPSVNPSNKNEVVMVEDNRRLVKLNISTGTSTVLAENIGTILTPDWGSLGWIVFSAGWKIWKVNSNGSGLEQLTNDLRDIWPTFNPSGNKVLYPRNREHAGDKNESVIMVIDLEGNRIDSFCPLKDNDCLLWEYSSWSSEQLLVAEFGYYDYSNGNGIAVYDTNGNTVSAPYEIPDKNYKSYPFIQDIEWHPNNGLIYFQDMRGIKSLDPENGKVKLLKKSCSEEFYEEFTITPDGEHIIAVKGEASGDKKTCIITEERYLVKMKINGSGEQRIEISQ